TTISRISRSRTSRSISSNSRPSRLRSTTPTPCAVKPSASLTATPILRSPKSNAIVRTSCAPFPGLPRPVPPDKLRLPVAAEIIPDQFFDQFIPFFLAYETSRIVVPRNVRRISGQQIPDDLVDRIVLLLHQSVVHRE